ncbi:MAG: anthranilate synthase component I [Pseudomonadota bacterium]
MITESEFSRLKDQGYNRIPVYCEILADLETPLTTYKKLATAPYGYLLESVQGGEKWGRYSIIGLPCKKRIEIRANRFQVFNGDDVIEDFESENPLDEIRSFQSRFKVPEVDGLPRFNGGLVGYFGYDTVSYIESRLGKNKKADPIGAPDIMLLISERVVVFDNLSGRLQVICYANPDISNAYESAQGTLSAILDAMNAPLPRQDSTSFELSTDESHFESSFPRSDFERAVERCREYIFEGDVFQVVISQRMKLPYQAAPLDLYRALRTLNPSPYMYYLNMGDFQIAGSSPEILVRLEDGEVTVRPIAGTRKRGATPAKDDALAKELLSDPKELAEHLMLIDLGRNDAGRVSRVGTVKVTDQMVIEKYSHVMHIVSNVIGQIRPELDAIDVLKATFPAGTLSGAPKVRALEIIEEIEPDKRGIYSGAVGYIGWNGNMDTAIAIRTALIRDGHVYIQAGAGVVADSIPENEWKETMNKGRAVFKAIEMAHNGLAKTLVHGG